MPSNGNTPDFRALFESSPGLYLVLTPDLRIAAASDAYLRATMTRREEILGRGLFEVFPDNPDDPTADGSRNLQASLKRVVELRRPDAMAMQKYDIRRPESEGGEFEVRYWSPVNSPIFDEDGSIRYIIHRVEDVTEFVRLKEQGAEQSLLTAQLQTQFSLRSLELDEANRRRRQLETFIQQAPVALAMFDRKMRYLRASRQWLEDRGVRDSDLVGLSQYDLFPNLPEEWMEAHRRGMAGESVRGETDWTLPDGTPRSLRWQIQPWGDAGIETGGIIIFAEDITERKRLDADLRKFESLADNSSEFIAMCDLNCQPLYVNEAGRRLLGLGDMEQARRTPVLDYFFPEDRRLLKEEILPRVMREGRAETEIRFRHFHSGEAIWMAYNIFQVKGPSGEPIALASVCRDITKRRMAEQALQDSEARFRSMYEHAAVGIEQVGVDGRILMVNQALCRMLGTTEAELLGRTFEQITHSGDREREAALLEETLRGVRDHYEIEKRCLHSDGSPVWVNVTSSPVRDAAGRALYRISVIQNITARRQVEEKLRGSEERLAAVIKTAMDAIITVDEQQRVVLFNAAAERIFGCPAADAIGKPLDSFLPARFREVHRLHVRKFGAIGETARSMSVPGTLFGRRATGDEFPIEATVSQATIGGQRFYTVILRDITRRKEAEEMARLYEQTREVDRLKTEFFANVSHELRTPLALILGPVRKLLAAEGLDGPERRDLELIERNALLLLRHVNDLLDLAKIDAGRMPPDYAEVDLAQLVRRVAANFESMAHDCAVGFLVDAPSAVHAELDPAKIERVLLNLLSNALKFTPAGGAVRVSARQDGHWAVVEVEDTGPGIPEELREIIFERFRQLEGGGDRRFGGTGLGLSIVKQFVDLHGGTVTVEAGANASGSLFRVELPAEAPEGAIVHRAPGQTDEELVRQALAGMAKEETSGTPAGAGPDAPLVLLVEDNPDMNQFLSDTLSASYRVRRAFDGQDGLQKAFEMPPDLILCDMMMPRMTGDRLVREIRRRPEFDDVPIVLLTAKADDELRVQLLKEGAQDYLHKPFDTRAVLAKVERLLADRKRRRQTEDALHRISGDLLQQQDRERRQLAVELNEHIAQCLAALGMYLQMAQAPGASSDGAGQSEIAQGMALLEGCLADVHSLSQGLHPLVLDHLGLPAALQWHIQSFSSSYGVRVTLQAGPDFGRLPGECELTLFRVLQDALERVRQAGSKRAAVRAFRDMEEAGLEVTAEDGTFAPVGESEEDLAMSAIRERVRKVGGRLELTGVAMQVLLPVPDMNP